MTEGQLKPYVTRITCSGVVANKQAEHYLAAKDLLRDSRTSSARHTWLFGTICTECAKTIETTFGRIAKLKQMRRRRREQNPVFRLRVFGGAGITFGMRSNEKLKSLNGYWNIEKHSGDGDEWKKNMKLETEAFAIETFNFAGAILAAFYRSCYNTEADWIEKAEAKDIEIRFTKVNGPGIGALLDEWEIELDTNAF